MVFIFNDSPVRDILDKTKDHSPEHRHEGSPGDDNADDNNDPEFTRDDDDNDSDYMPVHIPDDYSPDIGEGGIADCDDDNDDIDDSERDGMEFMSLQATAGASAGIGSNDGSSTRRIRRSSNQETVIVCGDPPVAKTGDGALLEPHAKFYIPRVPRGSNRSVIVFSPPL